MQGTAKSHEELLGSPTNARIWEFAKGVKTEIVVKKKQQPYSFLQPRRARGSNRSHHSRLSVLALLEPGVLLAPCPWPWGMCHDLKAVVLPQVSSV